MRRVWALLSAPDEEPITLAAAKAQVRVEIEDDDALITRMITGARSQVEQYLGRALLTQTWTYAQDGWSEVMVLPMAAPLQRVTAVKYYDAAGTLTTLSSSGYVVDTISTPGRLTILPTTLCPQLQVGRPLAVQVTYVAGWSDTADVPGAIVDAMHLLIGHRYENREAINIGNIVQALPLGVESLLASWRAWWYPGCEA